MGEGKVATARQGSAARQSDSFLQGLFQFGVYKGSQGRVTRQVTFAVLAMTFFLGAWRLFMDAETLLRVSGNR